MPSTDDYGFYPSWARRRTDGPASSPDINPAGSGLRRLPELQDLVRVSTMNPHLKNRLQKVVKSLGRLAKVARVGSGYEKESEFLISELLAQLLEDGHTGRHKVVRLVKSLKSEMKKDGYNFLGDK